MPEVPGADLLPRDDELPADQCPDVFGHLEHCARCRDDFEVQRTLKAVLARACALRASDELRTRILALLDES